MNKKKISLKIITPEGIVNDTKEFKISLHGELGDFEILPDHENYTSLLREGVISIFKDGNFIPYFIISKSFLIFDNSLNACEIASDYAINVLDLEKLENERINEIISNSQYEDEKSFYKFISQYLLQ